MYLAPITRTPTADSSLPLPDVTGDDSDTQSFFPGSYSIAECIGKYGVAAYLRVMRRRLEKGLYDRERFCFLAAQAYLWAKRPKRALALLQTCGEHVRPVNMAVFQGLVAEATHSCSERPPACSLNMIVKNEEKNIAAALDSVDDSMDEIVICDTGSTDRTIEIARIFGANVICREWQDDFSAARNAALDNSSGTWILWLDADDRLKPQSRHQLVNLIETARPHAAVFRVVNIQDNMQGAHFMQVRLFPRVKGARFERRIHEQICSSMTRLKMPYVEHQSIVIFHEGYNDPAANRRKAARNKPLILAEIADNRDSPVLLLSLADCLMILGETKEALAAYERLISHPSAKDLYHDIFVQAHFNVGLLYRSLGKFSIAKIWFERTIQLDSTRSEAYYLFGLIAEAEGDGDRAFSCFLTCSQKKPPVRQTATDSEKIRIDSVFRISQYLFDKGMLEQCEGILKPGCEKYPKVVNFHTLLGKVFLCKGNITDAARHFMTSLSLAPKNNPDPCRGMATIYLMLNDRSKAREFLAMAEASRQEPEKTQLDPGKIPTATAFVESRKDHVGSMAAA
jgi:glycosyltransferase involved in cell wall biosynthesis